MYLKYKMIMHFPLYENHKPVLSGIHHRYQPGIYKHRSGDLPAKGEMYRITRFII